jgi:hypothetical protein
MIGQTAARLTHGALQRFRETTGLANVHSLDLDSGVQRTVLARACCGRYVSPPGGRGFLLFLRDGILFAVGFDARTLETRGTPEPLAEDLARSYFGGGQFDISRSGDLLYLSGSSSAAEHAMAWMDATGKQAPLVSEPGFPDGRKRLGSSSSWAATIASWLCRTAWKGARSWRASRASGRIAGSRAPTCIRASTWPRTPGEWWSCRYRTAARTGQSLHVTILLNLADELRRRIPAPR